MTRTRWTGPGLTLALIVTLCFGAGSAFAAYLGTGSWPSGNLRRCHIGSYSTQCSSGATEWSARTDLNLSYSCSPLNFQTLGGNYGATGYAGIAYICAGPNESDCDTQTAWNGTYTYAEARNNTYYLSSWTDAQRQFNCMHEMGHVWSLGHDARTTSLLNSGQRSTITPDAGNISDVNAKY